MSKYLVKEYSSSHNGTIKLLRSAGTYSIEVNSITESGHELEVVWDEVFEKLVQKEILNKVLILGFGAGSVIKSIRQLSPNAAVTGVEIDSVMIKIAKKYFAENLEGVTIVIDDALHYIKKLDDTMVFDLVIVDCYIGDQEQKTLKTIKVLRKLKRISKRVLFNQLFLPNKKSELEKISFLPELDKLYNVKALKLPFNIIIEY